MCVPDSNWTGQGIAGLGEFRTEGRLSAGDIDVDVRRFRWMSRQRGPISPKRHYLDFSLGPRIRHSRVGTDCWSTSQYSGDILYLPGGDTYWGEPALEDRHILCAAFTDSFLDEIFQNEGGRPQFRPCADIRNGTLRRLLTALAAEAMAPGFASDMFVRSTMISAIIELARHLNVDRHSHRSPSAPSVRQIRIVTDYIGDNLHRNLNIVDIARECGISTRHLARLFKSETGMTLGEYVASHRITMAKDLLASGMEQIKEIGGKCGFQSASAFSAAFRSATGMTPGEFRALS